jgi:hypothetical protein
MFVSLGWTVRSIVLPEKRFVWKIRSMPPFSYWNLVSMTFVVWREGGAWDGCSRLYSGRTFAARAMHLEVR